MALTDYIAIRGTDGEEPFQGIGGGGLLTLGTSTSGSPIMIPIGDDASTPPGDTTTPPPDDTTTTPDDTTTPQPPTTTDSEVAAVLRQALLTGDKSGEESILAKAWLTADGASLFERAWLYQDGEALVSILRKAWLYQDTGDPAYKSILKKALLYVRNAEGQDALESVLYDMLKDLAFVDAVLDFGWVRVHIKGRTIEYIK